MSTGHRGGPEGRRAVLPTGSAPLSAEEDLAASIVETVPTPLMVLDADLRVHRANRAWHRAFGAGGEELSGRSLFDLYGGAWDIEELRTGLERVLPRARELHDLSIQYRQTDGEIRHLRLNARRVEGSGGRSPLVLLSVEDTTDFHRYEARIEEYARELERSNRDLESFAHAASHDLQEPLRKIRTYVERIGASLDPTTLKDPLPRYFQRLPEAAERMQRRIDDLLLYARIGSSGKDPEPVDLNEVVEATRIDLDVAITESGASIEVGRLPTVHADPSQLQLLFQNLVANGIKFAREGVPPTIRIHAEDPGANGSDTAEREAKPTTVIVVEDDGIGFEQEYADRIFLPFHRLHGREQYEGSGVGLAICRRIVEEHGGSIRAEGRPGEGAVFRFTLPLPAEPGETP